MVHTRSSASSSSSSSSSLSSSSADWSESSAVSEDEVETGRPMPSPQLDPSAPLYIKFVHWAMVIVAALLVVILILALTIAVRRVLYPPSANVSVTSVVSSTDACAVALASLRDVTHVQDGYQLSFPGAEIVGRLWHGEGTADLRGTYRDCTVDATSGRIVVHYDKGFNAHREGLRGQTADVTLMCGANAELRHVQQLGKHTTAEFASPRLCPIAALSATDGQKIIITNGAAQSMVQPPPPPLPTQVGTVAQPLLPGLSVRPLYWAGAKWYYRFQPVTGELHQARDKDAYLYDDFVRCGRVVATNDQEQLVSAGAVGARCGDKSERRTTADVVCATEAAILSVAEPRACVYHIVLGLPGACRAVTRAADEGQWVIGRTGGPPTAGTMSSTTIIWSNLPQPIGVAAPRTMTCKAPKLEARANGDWEVTCLP